ncbi:MAG: DNA replication/repair protein RecF [Lachnospiraceae bacterium]|nr:DNA replication/repair protein RecF [Lachnospiraceae bacterium]
MYINSLELNNYRNYNELNISFNKGITILCGDNAQGKTNVLEALYLAATTKSHRGSKDREIIMFNENEAHIRVHLSKHDVGHKIDMHLRKNKNKGVAIDGLSIKKSGELFGLINIIFFSPEDLSIIKNGPGQRRRFMNLELCQLNKIYYYNYVNYNKALNQRNTLLKQIATDKSKKDMLDVWDAYLIQYGKAIIEERQAFIDKLNDIVKVIHNHLTGGRESIEITYETNVSFKDYEKVMRKKRDTDIKYQSTQTGPHRDDICFLVNGIDVRTFGSQGQQRTAALSLKLAEIELVKSIIHDNPILLLDDVMSELDSNRRNYLLESIKDIQTIITCTGYDDFIKSRLTIDKIYEVVNGTISEMNIDESTVG